MYIVEVAYLLQGSKDDGREERNQRNVDSLLDGLRMRRETSPCNVQGTIIQVVVETNKCGDARAALRMFRLDCDVCDGVVEPSDGGC